MDDNKIIIISLASSLVTVMLFLIRICYKSKCSDVNMCCGLIKYHRNTHQETSINDNTP